jgi:hypothetical protein
VLHRLNRQRKSERLALELGKVNHFSFLCQTALAACFAHKASQKTCAALGASIFGERLLFCPSQKRSRKAKSGPTTASTQPPSREQTEPLWLLKLPAKEAATQLRLVRLAPEAKTVRGNEDNKIPRSSRRAVLYPLGQKRFRMLGKSRT